MWLDIQCSVKTSAWVHGGGGIKLKGRWRRWSCAVSLIILVVTVFQQIKIKCIFYGGRISAMDVISWSCVNVSTAAPPPQPSACQPPASAAFRVGHVCGCPLRFFFYFYKSTRTDPILGAAFLSQGLHSLASDTAAPPPHHTHTHTHTL